MNLKKSIEKILNWIGKISLIFSINDNDDDDDTYAKFLEIQKNLDKQQQWIDSGCPPKPTNEKEKS